MNEALCLQEFKNLAARLKIEIRYIHEGPSGLCTVKGSKVMFIDKSLDRRSQLDIFIRDFKTLDLEGFFIVPIIRRLLGLENEDSDW
ncbi:hypothetical protein ACFL6H_02510 [Candidatus Latescibacterota bacterium]